MSKSSFFSASFAAQIATAIIGAFGPAAVSGPYVKRKGAGTKRRERRELVERAQRELARTPAQEAERPYTRQQRRTDDRALVKEMRSLRKEEAMTRGTFGGAAAVA